MKPAYLTSFVLVAFACFTGATLADTLVEVTPVSINGPVLNIQDTALTLSVKPRRVYDRLLDGQSGEMDYSGYSGQLGHNCLRRAHDPTS